jgi:hypothetical protein
VRPTIRPIEIISLSGLRHIHAGKIAHQLTRETETNRRVAEVLKVRFRGQPIRVAHGPNLCTFRRPNLSGRSVRKIRSAATTLLWMSRRPLSAAGRWPDASKSPGPAGGRQPPGQTPRERAAVTAFTFAARHVAPASLWPKKGD